MVNAVFDHLIAIVLVGAIFVGTVVAMPAAIYFTTFQAVDQQQLKNTALNVFSAILQGTGSPANWGSSFPFNQNNVQTFGLAYSSSFSRYVLDADKVQRLDPNSPGYIDYARTRDLLELRGYGFKLSLYRPFKVGWDIQFESNRVRLSVNVTRTEDRTPIPNAQVKTQIIVTATNPNNEPLFIINEIPSKFTNLTGQCQINEPVTIPAGYTMQKAIAIMHIVVAGMDTMVVASKDTSTQDYLKINTFGDTVTLTYRGEFYGLPQGARKIQRMYAYDLVDLVEVYDGSKEDKINQGAGEYEYWNSTFPGLSTINPAMLLFVIKVTGKLMVVAGPFSFGEPDKIFEFGPTQPAGSVVSTTMRRFVVISGMTYVAELKLWKE